MIEVVVMENGGVVDRLEFDANDIVRRTGAVVSVHRGTMRHCARPGDLWYRVAHAAGWIAENGSAPSALKELERRGTALPNGQGPSPAGGQVGRPGGVPAPREIEDDDLYRLQRDRDEPEADYLVRCEMLGCDRQGFIRLPRRA